MVQAGASEFPRQFVASDVVLDQWAAIEPYYAKLLERDLPTPEAFESWLFDAGELEAVIDELATARYTAMTCATDDEDKKRAYLDYVENIEPKCEPWRHKLRLKFTAAAPQFGLAPQRYEVLQRSMSNAVELFKEENIPLHTEDARLAQKYQEITGGLTVQYEGEEKTIPQMVVHLESTDRAVREQVWRLVTDRYLADAPALDTLYGEMVSVRHKIARQSGLDGYAAYAFRQKERFDYTPDDCRKFHEVIEEVIVPAVGKLAEQRLSKLGLDSLRPWDFEVDPEGRPPLQPFESDEQLIAGCSKIFHAVDGELGGQFDRMQQEQMLDLGSRKGKAPGGYQANFAERRMPFIFMNAVGSESDVRTLLHEGGHAFHSFATREEPILAYRHAPMEFCEVASMAMECLALPHLDEFYGDDTPRAKRRFFSKIVGFFPWMARVDAFQHYVYDAANVEHDVERRKDEWQKLTQRFAPQIDYSDLRDADRHSWHQKLHFFQVPFYYVEYGIAQLGALQVWMNSRKDFAQAVDFYRRGLALGGSRPLPELFEAAGAKFDFSTETVKPLIDAVMEEIDALE